MKVRGIVFGAFLFVTLAAWGNDQYTVTIQESKVVLVPSPGWTVNQKFPWSLTCGSATIPKSGMTISPKRVEIDKAPAGKCTLRGEVWTETSADPFAENIIVPGTPVKPETKGRH